MRPLNPHEAAYDPAYPTESTTYAGLTVRAELAARAMQGFCANRALIDTFSGHKVVAEEAVAMADALIDALNQPKP